MKRAILIASLVLVLQLCLALGLWLKSDHMGTFQGGKLLTVAADQVDRLQIDGGDHGQIVLQKKDGHWQLPGHFGAPADGQKVDALLTTLLGIDRNWPVARTKDAFKRFKVADAGFERRLLFQSGDKTVATLLLGSSPGFRKVHARLAGEEEVYDIPFSSYQASLKPADWVDSRQLRLKPEQITAVDLPDSRLLVEKGKPKLANLAAGEETDGEHAQQLVDRLAGLNIQDIAAGSDQPLPHPADLSLRLELKDGTVRRYDFASGDDKSAALLKVSSAPYLFKVSSSLLKELQKATRATLVKAGKAPAKSLAQPAATASSQKSRG